MIRDRQIYRGFIAHYIGSPTVIFYLDGSGSPTQTIQLPNNPSYPTRLITSSAGVIGYVFKLDSNSEFEIDLEPVLEPTNNYTSLTYWDYYELTFEGTINVAIYVDNTATPVIASTTLNANFGQDTQKVYFPANTFGWVPYLVLTTNSTNDGILISQKPVAKPAESIMQRPLSVLRSLRLMYKGRPQISVSLDGSAVKTIATNTLPNHTQYEPASFSFASGHIGYNPHFSSTDPSNIADYAFVSEPAGTYSEQTLWHYYEVTFRGTVNVSLFLDNELIVGDGDDANATTNKTVLTTAKPQETKKVYLPALSYGRLPHVINDITDNGDILKWNPVALPARFYKSVQGVSECQVMHKGDAYIQFYLDGEELGEEYHLETFYDELGNSVYHVEKLYLPENMGGRVFQYRQTSGEGDILSVETDAHPIDFEPITVTEPS